MRIHISVNRKRSQMTKISVEKAATNTTAIDKKKSPPGTPAAPRLMKKAIPPPYTAFIAIRPVPPDRETRLGPAGSSKTRRSGECSRT
jgi:hypothetical protein